jgi:hypothetical protein
VGVKILQKLINMAQKRSKHDPNHRTSGWGDRFIAILERDYKNLDGVIAAILKDAEIARMCAAKIMVYVDKSFTDQLYGDRKARGAGRKKRLEIAIRGIKEAIALYRELGREQEAVYLSSFVIELSGQLGRSKEAYGTKRHGRDRSNLALFDSQLFLESALRQKITYATLANLVNAGFEAHGEVLKEPITEERMRKNLEHFKKRNPGAAALAARNYPRNSALETK